MAAAVLDHLPALARNCSSEARLTLLTAVSDLLFAHSAPTARAISDFNDIADLTLRHLRDDHRAAYAAHVAAEAKLPHPVALRLASDRCPQVAGLVLKLSPVLSDRDLAAVAVTQSPEALAYLAERQSLPRQIAAVVAERGAKGQPVAYVPDRPAGNSQPKYVAEEAQAIATWSTGSMSKPARGAAKPQSLVQAIKAGLRSKDEVVGTLATANQVFELAQVIGALAAVPDKQVLKALLDREVAECAEICRSFGLGRDGFRSILQLRASRLGLPFQQTRRDQEAYDDLLEAEAAAGR
jgi:uncharacterized protein (DUF2336 family)